MEKPKLYQRLYAQIELLISKSPSTLAQIATINAILYHKNKSISWCGLYLFTPGQLIVGPYQGLVACQILHHPNGVCWASVLEKKPLLVEDVHAFEGHIACDSKTMSELVLPLISEDGTVWGVYDIDSYQKAAFDNDDVEGVQKILSLVTDPLVTGKFYF